MKKYEQRNVRKFYVTHNELQTLIITRQEVRRTTDLRAPTMNSHVLTMSMYLQCTIGIIQRVRHGIQRFS